MLRARRRRPLAAGRPTDIRGRWRTNTNPRRHPAKAPRPRVATTRIARRCSAAWPAWRGRSGASHAWWSAMSTASTSSSRPTALRAAVDAVSLLLMEDHVASCLVTAVKTGRGGGVYRGGHGGRAPEHGPAGPFRTPRQRVVAGSHRPVYPPIRGDARPLVDKPRRRRGCKRRHCATCTTVARKGSVCDQVWVLPSGRGAGRPEPDDRPVGTRPNRRGAP